MKISAKGRYGLAAMAYIAQHNDSGDPITITAIADNLGISKIYLEQVFSLLKRAGLVSSVKGAQGGYQLTASPEKITAYAILSAIDLVFAEKTGKTVAEKAPAIERALNSAIFDQIDQSLRATLEQITLAKIVHEANKYIAEGQWMYFI